MTANQEPAPPAPVFRGLEQCGLCWRQTVEWQRSGLVAAAKWLEAAAHAADQHGPIPPVPALRLCRAVPDCDGLGCESPVRRDGGIQAQVTETLAHVFLSNFSFDARVTQTLLSANLQWAVRIGAVPDAAQLRSGPISQHALLVAGNLASTAVDDPDHVPSLRPRQLSAATKPSLEILEWLIKLESYHSLGHDDPLPTWPQSSRCPGPSGSDVLALNWLHTGLERLRTERVRVAEEVAPLAVEPKSWWIRLLEFLGWHKPAAPPAPVPPECLPLLPSTSESEELFSRFQRCDVMGNATNAFAGTVLADPKAAAGFLRQLRRAPDADLVMPRLIQKLAATGLGGNHDWLYAVGRLILEDDPDSAGSDVATHLLAEYVAQISNQHPAGEWESHPLWSALAPSGEDPERLATGFPGLFVRLCRRAAVLEELSQPGPCERRTVRRVADMVVVLWNRTPLISVDWQRLFFQCLTLFLEGQPLRAQLPSGTGIQMSTLASMALQIRQALAEGEDGNAALKPLVDAVCNDHRFPLWTDTLEKTRQSPATPPDRFDEYLFSTRGEPPPRNLPPPPPGQGGDNDSKALKNPPPKSPKTPANRSAPTDAGQKPPANATPTGKRKRKSR